MTVTDRPRSTPRSSPSGRRAGRLLGAAGRRRPPASRASASAAGYAVAAAGPPRRRRRRSPFRGAAPGRDHHPRAGPAALRRVRRDHRRPGRRSRACCSAGPRAAERMTRGRGGGAGRRGQPATRRRRRPTPARRSACPPSSLTLTFGFGAVAVRRQLGPRRASGPPRSPTLPTFPGDELDPALSGGDLCVQACANDPQVAVHAIRNLARIGFGTTAVRWSQLGFGRTSSTSTRAGHAAQPVRLQGRHPQPQGRGHRPLLDQQSGCSPATGRRGSTGGTLPGGPPDPDAHRDLGPHVAGRAGEHHRPEQGRGRAARAGRRVRRSTSNLADPTASRDPGDAHIRLAVGAEPRRRADPAPRLQLRRRQRRAGPPQRGPVLHRATSATRTRQFVPMQRALAGKDRMMEYIEHTGLGGRTRSRAGWGRRTTGGQALLEA